MVRSIRAVQAEPGRVPAVRWRLGLVASALAAIVGLTGCSTSGHPPAKPSAQGSAAASGAGGHASIPTTTVPATSAPASTAPQTPLTGLANGPGPQSHYVVEPQPPAGSCHYGLQGSDPLPDPHCTPGALNPQVSQATLASTICRSGYSSSIRPPETVTGPEKRASAAAYSYNGAFSTGEYDHLVALELGGDPNDPANLWVEPNDNPNATTTTNAKDALENRLHGLVCSGQLPLATAQQAIASNWVTAYQRYVGGLPTPSPAAGAPAAGAAAPPSRGASCAASAVPANDGYAGDDYVSVTSNQPDERATASDARDSWSHDTDASGAARILLYHASPGEQINVTVGAASCSTVAP